MPFIQLNGHKFHYWLNGEGPDLVMIHGLGGNLAVWHLRIVPNLDEHFRILTFDLRGHGRSDESETGYSTNMAAEDLLHLMDALGIEKTHMVGHCLGSDIALHFALHYPERVENIVAIEGPVPALLADYVDDDWQGWEQLGKVMGKITDEPINLDKLKNMEWVLNNVKKVPILYGLAKGNKRSKKQIDRILKSIRKWNSESKLNTDLDPANMANIENETLLVYDSNSIFRESHDWLQKNLPNNKSVLLPESEIQHFSTLEFPDLIVQNIKEFLLSDETASA